MLFAVGCDNIKPPPITDTDTDDTGPAGACFESSVADVDFGDVSYAELNSSSFTISNPCSEDLVITQIGTESPFQVSPAYLTLRAGGFATITLYVQATEYGEFTSDISFTTDNTTLGAEGVVTIPVRAHTIADVDGDGFETVDAGGTDCDDDDAGVNPDAVDEWYDGVDSNCDGANDYDQDGDGFDAELDDHELPAGTADCNDTSADFYPGAPDEPYDNRDTDCGGGNDWDWDGDGFESAAYGRGSDCDDFDPTVNRDGIEALNGKDDDCDGSTDNDALANGSLYYYDADGTWDRTGYSMALGDINADGIAELLVGAPYVDASSGAGAGRGGVAVFDAPDLLPAGTDINRADNWFDGDGGSDLLGVYLSVIGDFDGDGENDVAIGATGASAGGSGSGSVYLLQGSDARRGDTGDAMAVYTGITNAAFGRGIATDVDLNNDSMDELVVMYTSGGTNYVALEYGSASPTSASVNGVDAKWSTTGSEAAFYRNAPVGGDFDGDGYEDLLLSDGKADDAASDGGAAWVLWGQSTQYSVPTATAFNGTATAIIRGTSSSDYDAWATQLGEDWDGDGDAELWVYNADEALYVVEGGPTRRFMFEPANEAVVTYTWDSAEPDIEMLRMAGDWDGDGISDMFAFVEDESGSYGRCELYPSSNTSGTWAASSAIIGNLTGGTDETAGDNGNVGFGMTPMPGDVDGDGDLDIAVGDPEFNSNAGRAYVLLNKNTAE
jgi:hypothetical protein